MKSYQTTQTLLLLSIIALSLAPFLTGCTTTTLPLTEIEVPVPDISLSALPLPKVPLLTRGDDDFRGRGWAQAFLDLHQRMVREYPYSEWKAIDWKQRYTTYAPLINQAEKDNDVQAYYEALRAYTRSIPDGNMRIENVEEYRREHIGGSFGFGLMQLDDGRVIVHILLGSGPAANIGLKWGAEILEWNHTPIKTALEQTDLLWAKNPQPVTTEAQRLAQLRYLPRGPIGEQAVIMFRNPDSTTPWVATITAVEDNYEVINRTYPHNDAQAPFEAPLIAKTLDDGYAYIRIYFEAPTLSTPFPANYFQRTLNRFIKDDAPGLILDVRGNSGGDISYVPKFCAAFFDKQTFFHSVALYNHDAKTWGVDDNLSLRIKPDEPRFDKPIIVLIDENTFGAGEGFPLALAALPNVQTLGFHGTHGTFGLTGGDVIMPKGFTLSYPVGRSLDADGRIQLESNAQGQGGLQPDIRIPLTEDNIRALYKDNQDVLLQEALNFLKK